MQSVLRLLMAIFLACGFSPVAVAAPAMWEVSDKDSKIWLFGSVHILPARVTWRTPAIDAALAASEKVYFETDIGPLGQIAIVFKAISMAAGGPATPWLDRLSEADLTTLAEVVAPLGMTVEQLGGFPPWLAEVQVETGLMTASPGGAADPDKFDASKGVDVVLQWELPPERKAYFETPAEQMDLLASGTEDEQIARLVAVIKQAAVVPDALRALVTAWTSGDVETIGTTTASELADAPEFGQRLLLDRNRKWLPVIESLLAGNHQDLIVVGAAHLAGTGSVLDLLSAAGYTVTRIQ